MYDRFYSYRYFMRKFLPPHIHKRNSIFFPLSHIITIEKEKFPSNEVHTRNLNLNFFSSQLSRRTNAETIATRAAGKPEVYTGENEENAWDARATDNTCNYYMVAFIIEAPARFAFVGRIRRARISSTPRCLF